MKLYVRVALDPDAPKHRQRYCWQQAGVSAILDDDHGSAYFFLQRAKEGATDLERANLLRDEGKLLMQMASLNEAEQALSQSLSLLEDLPDQVAAKAMTIDFLGRLHSMQGNHEQALADFTTACGLLLVQGTPELRLYNRLNLASEESRTGDWFMSRVDAIQAYKLAKTSGGRPHRLRALALLIGGHRLESLARKLWH